jgi:hypothetical protein
MTVAVDLWLVVVTISLLSCIPWLPIHFSWSPQAISVLYGAIFTLSHELESRFLVTVHFSISYESIWMTYGNRGVFSRSSPSKPCKFLSRVSEEYTSAMVFFNDFSAA